MTTLQVSRITSRVRGGGEGEELIQSSLIRAKSWKAVKNRRNIELHPFPTLSQHGKAGYGWQKIYGILKIRVELQQPMQLDQENIWNQRLAKHPHSYEIWFNLISCIEQVGVLEPMEHARFSSDEYFREYFFEIQTFEIIIQLLRSDLLALWPYSLRSFCSVHYTKWCVTRQILLLSGNMI